jgi:hypothetical protein
LERLKINKSFGIWHSLGNGGQIWTPNGYSRKGRGTDSEMGTLSNSANNISFDIGFLAGVHIGNHNKQKFAYYFDTIVNGNKTAVGVNLLGDEIELIVTVYGGFFYENKPFLFPANFRAVIKGIHDLVEVLSVANSYSPYKLN